MKPTDPRQDQPDDSQVISQILQGNNQAFAGLVAKYQQMVFRTCFSFIRNKEDAEDLAQEVFVEVFRSLPSFRNEAGFSTWLYRIAINKSLNQVRKVKNRSFIQSIEQFLAWNRPSLQNQTQDPDFETNEGRQMIYKAIHSLPQNQKIAFTLHKVDELSHSEVAEIMGVSIPAVESLVHRAKGGLKHKLARYFKT